MHKVKQRKYGMLRLLAIVLAVSVLAGCFPFPDGVGEAHSDPPLYVFYAIHVHQKGGADHHPYRTPQLQRIDKDLAKAYTQVIGDLADVLNKHDFPGTWQVIYGLSRGLCTLQGPQHVFRALADEGHEIATHFHDAEDMEPALENLRDDCGLPPTTISGLLPVSTRNGTSGAQETISGDIELHTDLGASAATINLSPARRNPFTRLCRGEIGVGNDMAEQTGNLMFPWKPDYRNNNICNEDASSDFVLVDHVNLGWAKRRAGPVSAEQFERLREKFDEALEYMQHNHPERVAAWGFVTHIYEYTTGQGANMRTAESALEALSDFLDDVDREVDNGRVVYATAGQIADLVLSQ